jgi:WD40 repeat protein
LKDAEFRSLLADARFLMRDYQIPIVLSALQVYHSGVVSMPKCALRRQATGYSTARMISERDHTWQTKNMILEGHTGDVYSVAFSSDGSRIVSGSKDCTVRIWDAVSDMVLYTLEGHTDWVRSVAFSSEGLHIVSGSDDRTVRIWDAISGVVQHTLKGHTDWVRSVAFSSNGSRIVSGSRDCTVRIWDAVSGVVLHTLESHTGKVNSVAFSLDGLRIVSGSRDHTVRICDASTGEVQNVIERYTWLNDLQSFLADSLPCNGLSTSLKKALIADQFFSLFNRHPNTPGSKQQCFQDG